MDIIKQYLTILFKFIKKYFWIVLIFAIFLFVTYYFHIINCPVKFVTGFPCPGCGMTRAGFALLRFDFVAAFNYNPMIFILPFILWVVIFKERPIISKIYKNNIFWIIILVLVLATYILRFIFVYPNVPMDYYENNIISLIIGWFK